MRAAISRCKSMLLNILILFCLFIPNACRCGTPGPSYYATQWHIFLELSNISKNQMRVPPLIILFLNSLFCALLFNITPKSGETREG